MEDMNKSTAKIIDINIEDYTKKETEEGNLAYVCYSRCVKELVNAKHLLPYKDNL